MVCDEGKLGGGREGSPSKLRTGVSTIGTSSLPAHDVTLPMPGKVKGGCEVDVQDEREGLIRTLLVELEGQILVLFSRGDGGDPDGRC